VIERLVDTVAEIGQKAQPTVHGVRERMTQNRST
jgi:hypothetical protein